VSGIPPEVKAGLSAPVQRAVEEAAAGILEACRVPRLRSSATVPPFDAEHGRLGDRGTRPDGM